MACFVPVRISEWMTPIYCNYVISGRIFRRQFSLGLSKYTLKSWSIVFFGSDAFSLAHLKCLHEHMGKKIISGLEVVVVNEANSVYRYAKSNDIKTHFWPPNLNGSYDLGVIASFGKFIPEAILLRFPLGILNVHGSLLPKWRGGMPVAHAVINGDATTGVTVTRIRHDKWDAGGIILQRSCEIGKNELMPSIMRKLAHLGTNCLTEVLSTLPECLESGYPQSDEEATFAPRIKKDAAVIRWNDMTALQVFNLHRGLFSTYDLKSTWKGGTVKFVCLSLQDTNNSVSVDGQDKKLEPGRFTYQKQSGFLLVQCKDRMIRVCSFKYGNKLHTGDSFYKGYLHRLPGSEWKFGD